MSEVLRDAVKLDDYQQFVWQSELRELSEDSWMDVHARLIEGEQVEFLTQHGLGAALLYAADMGYIPTDEPTELHFKMADEMGDTLWFSTNVAKYMGLTLEEVCFNALRNKIHSAEGPISNFNELEVQALAAAPHMSVPTKAGLMFLGLTLEQRQRSLVEHPFYVYMRLGHRLTRSLEKGQRDMAPPTATEMEPLTETTEALGNFVLAMAYIAHERLHISMDDIANFNMEKLKHRGRYGKENDLSFDQSYIRTAVINPPLL